MSKLFLLFIASGLAAQTAAAAVFGTDDREPIGVSSPVHGLSRSVAIAVLSTMHTVDADGKVTLSTESMKDDFCADERFRARPVLPYSCTAFLVAPDLIATAGHCMVNTGESRDESGSFCEVYSWLFGYDDSVRRPSAKDLYRCKKIIYAVRDEEAPFRDYALVRLDRPVEGRAPLKLSSAKGLAANERLSMIGHPLGMPLTLSKNARVLLYRAERTHFVTNLDAFNGNSGSPVFNSRNEVVGILTSGTPSSIFSEDSARRCKRMNRCDESGSTCTAPDADTSVFPNFQRVGSDVQKIDALLEHL